MNSGRVILHIDLDCFYCQVEQKRLGIPRDVPAAVQQWEGLIAINYAARAAGITRHMRVREALQKVPDLKCMHVQTIGGECGQEGNEGALNPGLVHPNDRSLQKACLERYRRACAEILKVLHQTLPQAIIEKASIDEVYVDVTQIVEQELKERDQAETGDAFAWGSIVLNGPLDPESEFDRRLSIGASLACRLRGAVFNHLGFTSSAGIAGNKLLAKVASAKNKPNKQTVVPARAVLELMATLPLKKLRNFGGKLGAELETLGASTAGQVAALPFQTLEQRFGERARWILNAVNGINDEPVQVKELPKSMLAAKSFEATADNTALARWLGILAEELAERMVVDAEENLRHPRLLVLSYRKRGQSAGRSKSGPMPRASGGPSAAMLKDAAVTLLQKCPDAIPSCNLGLSATDFVAAPTDERAAITRFFVPVAQSGTAEPSPVSGTGTAGPPPQQPPPLPKPRPAPHRNTITSMFGKAAAAAPKPRQQNRPPGPLPRSCARETPPQQASRSSPELDAGLAGDLHVPHAPARKSQERTVTGMLRDAVAAASAATRSAQEGPPGCPGTRLGGGAPVPLSASQGSLEENAGLGSSHKVSAFIDVGEAFGDRRPLFGSGEDGVQAPEPLHQGSMEAGAVASASSEGCLQELGLVSPHRSLHRGAGLRCSQRMPEAECSGGAGSDGGAALGHGTERPEARSSGVGATGLGAVCGKDGCPQQVLGESGPNQHDSKVSVSRPSQRAADDTCRPAGEQSAPTGLGRSRCAEAGQQQRVGRRGYDPQDDAAAVSTLTVGQPGETAPVAGSGGGAPREIGGRSSCQLGGQASVSGSQGGSRGDTRIASTSSQQLVPSNKAKQPGEGPGSRESGAHAGQPGADLAGLEGVDLQEQKRILRDIWVRSRTGQAAGSEMRKEDVKGGSSARKSSRRDGGDQGIASKQPRISALFARAAARQPDQES